MASNAPILFSAHRQPDLWHGGAGFGSPRHHAQDRKTRPAGHRSRQLPRAEIRRGGNSRERRGDRRRTRASPASWWRRCCCSCRCTASPLESPAPPAAIGWRGRRITSRCTTSSPSLNRMDIRPMCPFGPNWCGNGPPCPMHDAISAAAEQVDSFLQKQHLGPFCGLKSRSR
jgi:hypothetical protein